MSRGAELQIIFSHIVSDSPKITCHQAEANVDDINVSLKCDVRSKPRPIAMFWVVSINGTVLKPGEVTDEFWSVVKVTLRRL
jgi:hypothetical protein